MGLPFAFLGPTPLLLAWLSGKGGPWAGPVAGASWIVGLVAFAGGLAGWWGSSKSLKMSLVAMPLLAAALLLAVEPAGRSVALTSFSCSCLAGLATLPPKRLFRRKRPIVALASQVTQRRSVLLGKYMDTLLSENQRMESHPSGDTAVMAANAVVLWAIVGGDTAFPVAVAATLTCGFGRMYFWAHHLLDVTVGGALGLAVALACLRLNFGSGWGSCAISYVGFVVSAAIYLKSLKVK
ncbi:unnamed protein product [Prorocentrum cordatum]|uniref:Phosphatidic acid phosphatase type 2/haloperoxidase domain-containing protein n=1 Tax=Prorocentrum cordatum TaxID=2364126 RepID=A0ABN9WAT6_9DINO|nr:unnamed protein product [Polarella glacialis]